MPDLPDYMLADDFDPWAGVDSWDDAAFVRATQLEKAIAVAKAERAAKARGYQRDPRTL